MSSLNLEKRNESKSKIIAESSNNLKIELIKELGVKDCSKIIELSKEFETTFGKSDLISTNNVHRYFNDKTFPFVARLNDDIIGFIIGAPLEIFSNESWSHYDNNLGKKNTIYTYIYLVKKFYRKKIGYSKTLKMVYLNWCMKNNFKYVTGHVKAGMSRNFSNDTKVIKIFPKWYNCKEPFEYYRRPL